MSQMILCLQMEKRLKAHLSERKKLSLASLRAGQLFRGSLIDTPTTFGSQAKTNGGL